MAVAVFPLSRLSAAPLSALSCSGETQSSVSLGGASKHFLLTSMEMPEDVVMLGEIR